jgi:signal transduction histidine kinase
MSSDVISGTGRIAERARPDRAVERAVPRPRAPGVSDRSCRILASTNEAIIRASDPDAMYAELCEILVRQGGYPAAWVDELVDGSTLRPVARADERSDEDGSPTCGTPLQVPLRHAGSTAAVLSLVPGPVDETDAEATDLLRRVAANVSFALGSFAAARRMRELAEDRRRLVRGVVSAEQRERVRIANDIHDESVPLLAALELRLGLLGQSAAAADPDVQTTLTEMQTTLSRAVTGLRDLLFELDDESADDLLSAVREAAEQILDPFGVRWELVVEGTVGLPEIERLQALRILKEALVNVRKHAHASAVRIAVQGGPQGVEVTVADDGVGMSGTPGRRPGHRGMASMRHRAEISGGWLTVDSGPDRGTTVRYAVPISTSALDEVEPTSARPAS